MTLPTKFSRQVVAACSAALLACTAFIPAASALSSFSSGDDYGPSQTHRGTANGAGTNSNKGNSGNTGGANTGGGNTGTTTPGEGDRPLLDPSQPLTHSIIVDGKPVAVRSDDSGASGYEAVRRSIDTRKPPSLGMEQIVAGARHLPIYGDGSWVKRLERPEVIAPGVRILIQTTTPDGRRGKGLCSVGWNVTGKNNQPFFVTAGHCGKVGDKVYIHPSDPSKELIEVGEVVSSVLLDGRNPTGSAEDFAIVKITNFNVRIEPTPFVMKGPNGKMMAVPVAGSLSREDLDRLYADEETKNRVAMCILGATTGFSCGAYKGFYADGTFEYRTLQYAGDSGGAVFLLTNTGRVWAVGITNSSIRPNDRPEYVDFGWPLVPELLAHRLSLKML